MVKKIIIACTLVCMTTMVSSVSLAKTIDKGQRGHHVGGHGTALSHDGVPNKYSRVLTMQASAYSAQDPGNGNYTATGSRLKKGIVSVDPKLIPLGTKLYIEGYGYAVADDVGGAIKGHRIDLAYDSRSEALQFGRQTVKVYVL